MKDTAAVIVTYNRKEILAECLAAVLSQKEIVPEVIVVDNDSKDGTKESLEDLIRDGKVIYYNTGANLGGAGGFQYGIRKAVGAGYKFLWIMDDDCIPSPDALSALNAAARQDSGFGFLASKVLWKDGSICRMNVQRERLTKNVKNFDRRKIPVVMSSFVSLFLPVDVIKDVGLPIKEFFIWTDDWEFTRRISRKYPCWLVTDSVVVHKSKANIAADISRESAERLDRFYYLYRNDVVLYRREGFRGFSYEFIRLTGHCVRVLLRSEDNKLLRIGKIIGGTAAGLKFRPKIEYAETAAPIPEMQRKTNIRVLEAFGEPVADGGQEAFVFNTLKNMDRNGLQIDFLTAYDLRSRHYCTMAKEMGGKLYALKLPFMPGKSRHNIAAPFREFLRKHHYDVIHIHSGSISVLAIMSSVADKAGVKRVIVHSHVGGEKDSLKHRLLRFCASLPMRCHVDVYCACSAIAAEWKYEPVYSEKALIIKNGIDILRFAFDAGKREQIRRTLGFGEKTFVLGNAGRFSRQKNQAFLINIFAEVVKKEQDSRLLLAGDGEEMDRIRVLVKQKGLEEKVVFTGSVTDVENYLQAMDVFLLPSLYEGLPIAAVEAQCSGLPVLFSDTVTREAGITGSTVYLSLKDSAASWADAALSFRGYRRTDQSQQVQNAGFDIQMTASLMRRMYTERKW